MKASLLCSPFGGLIASGLLAALGAASADVRTRVAPAEKEPVVFPGAEWAQATPQSQGVDAAKLKAAVEYLASGLKEYGGARTRLAEAVAPQPVPIRLHPDNPRYFLWRGKPTVLITSGEHYGAVMNLDAEWVNAKTGAVEKSETIRHAGGSRSLASPVYPEDIALRLRRQ